MNAIGHNGQLGHTAMHVVQEAQLLLKRSRSYDVVWNSMLTIAITDMKISAAGWFGEWF